MDTSLNSKHPIAPIALPMTSTDVEEGYEEMVDAFKKLDHQQLDKKIVAVGSGQASDEKSIGVQPKMGPGAFPGPIDGFSKGWTLKRNSSVSSLEQGTKRSCLEYLTEHQEEQKKDESKSMPFRTESATTNRSLVFSMAPKSCDQSATHTLQGSINNNLAPKHPSLNIANNPLDKFDDLLAFKNSMKISTDGGKILKSRTLRSNGPSSRFNKSSMKQGPASSDIYSENFKDYLEFLGSLRFSLAQQVEKQGQLMMRSEQKSVGSNGQAGISFCQLMIGDNSPLLKEILNNDHGVKSLAKDITDTSPSQICQLKKCDHQNFQSNVLSEKASKLMMNGVDETVECTANIQHIPHIPIGKEDTILYLETDDDNKASIEAVAADRQDSHDKDILMAHEDLSIDETVRIQMAKLAAKAAREMKDPFIYDEQQLIMKAFEEENPMEYEGIWRDNHIEELGFGDEKNNGSGFDDSPEDSTMSVDEDEVFEKDGDVGVEDGHGGDRIAGMADETAFRIGHFVHQQHNPNGFEVSMEDVKSATEQRAKKALPNLPTAEGVRIYTAKLNARVARKLETPFIYDQDRLAMEHFENEMNSDFEENGFGGEVVEYGADNTFLDAVGVEMADDGGRFDEFDEEIDGFGGGELGSDSSGYNSD